MAGASGPHDRGAGSRSIGVLEGDQAGSERRGGGGESWPGQSAGVRAPAAGEVALSRSEVAHGQAIGLFWPTEVDEYPMIQRRVPAGQWTTRDMGARHATPWDAMGVM